MTNIILRPEWWPFGYDETPRWQPSYQDDTTWVRPPYHDGLVWVDYEYDPDDPLPLEPEYDTDDDDYCNDDMRGSAAQR